MKLHLDTGGKHKESGWLVAAFGTMGMGATLVMLLLESVGVDGIQVEYLFEELMILTSGATAGGLTYRTRQKEKSTVHRPPTQPEPEADDDHDEFGPER